MPINDQKLVLNYAHEWGLTSKVPKIRFLKESKNLPTYVPAEHLAAILEACENAERPNDIPNVSACNWWRGLLVMGYMTGWRIGQLLSIKWADIDLDGMTMTTRADVGGKNGFRFTPWLPPS